MQLETDNEKAQTLVANAASEIHNYRVDRSFSKLKSAKEILDEARREDPQYLSAIYYTAVLDDLLGKAHSAIPSLEKVLEAEPPFSDEVRYHLGIAYYHRYNSENLDRAIECFKRVYETAPDSLLRTSASAALGQAYAMKIIPSSPQSVDVEKNLKYHKLSLREGRQSLKLADELDVSRKNPELNEPRWMAHNAVGMANMYFSDYDGKAAQKIEVLNSTIDQFTIAEEYRPKDWANYCDLASAHMRLGYWSSTQSHFDAAEKLLSSVVTSLRPDYGFAIYELGRNFRLQGDFRRAVSHFDRALSIPYETRDVSDRRVNVERNRAIRQDRVFP
jgi:tetratricopeptide (TPR) repeat protein